MWYDLGVSPLETVTDADPQYRAPPSLIYTLATDAIARHTHNKSTTQHFTHILTANTKLLSRNGEYRRHTEITHWINFDSVVEKNVTATLIHGDW